MLIFLRFLIGAMINLIHIGIYLFVANKYKPLKKWDKIDLILFWIISWSMIILFLIVSIQIGSLFI